MGGGARILVVNAGSSSVKLSLIGERDEELVARELASPEAQVDPAELRAALDGGLGDADAVGHRIVHGGERFRAPVRIDAAVARAVRELTELAPLHQPKSLAALDLVSAALPQLPAVACFDTAFHADMPPGASTYALPSAWRERWPIRRYGFHGLSHAWVSRRVPQLLGADPAGPRIVSCHLGAGASACAIAGGRSVATTMGFTPLEGLAMATRSGSVDPGLVLWLLERPEISAADLSHGLEHDSGMQGLAGTPDMREVVARSAQGDRHANLALSVYTHRLRGAIAAMAAALGGADALAFTGGAGERSAEIRARASAGMSFMGAAISPDLNEPATPDCEISREGSPVRTFVIRAREDLEIARQVRTLLGDDAG
jgi:acetate kinase